MEELSEQQQEQPAGPRVSVIVASFHRAAMLRRCLEALEKSEDKERCQIIVLDIGTHDTTSAWDLDFPQITFLRMPRNFGVTKALNIGIRSAKAQLLLFLDPAIEVQTDTIGRLATVLEDHKEAVAACPLLLDRDGAPVPQVRALPDRVSLWRAWQKEDAISVHPPSSTEEMIPVEFPGLRAILVWRTFLKGMNYFDERYGEWGGDLELAYQIRHAGRKTLIVPSIQAIDHSGAEAALAWSSSQQAALTADRLNGAAHFLGKRAGFFPKLLFKLQAILTTLGRALTFQRPAYNWRLFFALVSGEKIDGSQGGL
ncbi:MAG TPA: glycosyltransferase family 2 protein [Bryobacteraceae bacterium]|nr:glycosyltransferase family 2 protein [Bryobacteraceae bacterium]